MFHWPRLHVNLDLDLLGYERSSTDEVHEARHARGLDVSVEFEDGVGGHVEWQGNTHRSREDERVAEDGERLVCVDSDAFSERVDPLGGVVHRWNKRRKKHMFCIIRILLRSCWQKQDKFKWFIHKTTIEQWYEQNKNQPCTDNQHIVSQEFDSSATRWLIPRFVKI